jgi:hypothetical protein
MDTNTVIIISVFCGTSSLCLCCILIKALKYTIEERRQQRLKIVAKKIQDRIRYNSLIYPDEYLRKEDIV